MLAALSFEARISGAYVEGLPQKSNRSLMLSVGARPGISKGWLASMSVKPTPSETRYVQSGDILVAYQVFGDGPRDLVIVPGFVSHIE